MFMKLGVCGRPLLANLVTYQSFNCSIRVHQSFSISNTLFGISDAMLAYISSSHCIGHWCTVILMPHITTNVFFPKFWKYGYCFVIMSQFQNDTEFFPNPKYNTPTVGMLTVLIMLCNSITFSTCIFIRLITSNPNFEEIDFEHNHIGNAAGREILHAMQQRKEGITISICII